jgi:hypothetical protein
VTIVSDVKDIQRADIGYQIAATYYEGQGVKEVFANKNTAAILGQNADHYNINIAKRGVDGVMDKLVIEGWAIDVDGRKNPAAEQSFRENVWDHNELEALLPDALEAAEEYGDAYLLAWPVEDDSATEVDVFLHKPIGARMVYDPGNERVPLRYVRTWLIKHTASSDDQKAWFRRVNIIDAGFIRKLISRVPALQADTDAEYEEYDGEDPPRDAVGDTEQAITEPLPPGVSVNPYGRIPVAHLRTRRPYGTPEHACLYGCQNLLIKVIATLGESVDGFGIPWRYRTLDSDKLLKPGTDEFDQQGKDDDEDDRVRTRAGEMANLYDTESVGQLVPADSKNLLDPIDKVMQLAATVSTTPLDYFDASAASASGESKKEHKGPYLSKIGKRRTDLGRAIVEVLEFALVDILGHVGAAVTLVWQALHERTDAERYQQIKDAVEAHVPWVVACVEAGYDQEVVDEWVANGWAPEDSPAARVALFQGIAAGTRDLAAAANLGGIDATAAQQLIAQALARSGERKAVASG